MKLNKKHKNTNFYHTFLIISFVFLIVPAYSAETDQNDFYEENPGKRRHSDDKDKRVRPHAKRTRYSIEDEEAVKQRIEKLLDEGKGRGTISDTLGIPQSVVKRLIKACTKKYPDFRNEITRLRGEKKSVKEIAKSLNIYETAVYSAIHATACKKKEKIPYRYFVGSELKQQVVDLSSCGRSNTAIAKELNISRKRTRQIIGKLKDKIPEELESHTGADRNSFIGMIGQKQKAQSQSELSIK